MKLPERWVNKIVLELQGIYGQQFTGKFSKIESGIDVGIANFKESLATRLAGFVEHPESIGYALSNLPTSHCPNVLELLEIAQRAPKKRAQAIEYKQSEEDIERSRRMAEKATQAVRSHVSPMHCWEYPRSQLVAEYLFDASKHRGRFQRLASVFDKHVMDGVISDSGKLLKRWDGFEWVKP